MEAFLCSSPCLFDENRRARLNPANGLVEELARVWPQAGARCLLVCSDPHAFEMTDHMAADFEGALSQAGLSVRTMSTLDARNARDARTLAGKTDVVLLGGGHVPTQNAFFHVIGLSDIMSSFNGIVIGISAGTMNSARTVYAMPELPGEATDTSYERFLTGLGLTERMIIPHYQDVRTKVLDGLRAIEDIACPDSAGREFLVLEDGDYLHIQNGVEHVRGHARILRDGVLGSYRGA